MNKKSIQLKWDDVIQPGDQMWYPHSGEWRNLNHSVGKTIGSLFLDSKKEIGWFCHFMLTHFNFERNRWLNRFEAIRILE